MLGDAERAPQPPALRNIADAGRAIRAGLRRVMSSPRTRTEPPLARNRPMMVLHSVVLPMPLRPTTENTPESSVRSTPCSACEWP